VIEKEFGTPRLFVRALNNRWKKAFFQKYTQKKEAEGKGKTRSESPRRQVVANSCNRVLGYFTLHLGILSPCNRLRMTNEKKRRVQGEITSNKSLTFLSKPLYIEHHETYYSKNIQEKKKKKTKKTFSFFENTKTQRFHGLYEYHRTKQSNSGVPRTRH